MCKRTQIAEAAAARVADYVRAFVTEPDAFRGQQLRGTGFVREFEQLLASRCGFPFCLATSNATTALLVAAVAVGLPGKEVIAPPHCWEPIWGVLHFVGAKVIRAEADESGNIDPKSIERSLSARTAGVVAVDWAGRRHSAASLRGICDDAGCRYIEDSSRIPNQRTDDECSIADIQVISFGPGKPLCLGEGGALLTRSQQIYDRAVALSQHPERCFAEGIAPFQGNQFLNGRMHQVTALLGLALLRANDASEI